MSTALMMPVIIYPREVGLVAVTENRQSLGKLLRERRTERDIPQDDIADALEFVQSYISKLERGGLDRAMYKWKPDRIWAMLKAYKYSDDEARTIAEEFGLDIPYEKRHSIPDLPPGAALATTDGPKAMYYGPVSAGIKGDGKPIKPHLVNIPSWLAKKYNPADIFVVTVDGDSMTCDDIRKSIPEGTEVYFHSKLDPHPGEVVTVWLENCDFNVIKIYKPQRDQTVLQSYNFKHPPIIVDESNPARIQGVYVGKSEPSWTRFDR